MKKKSSKMQSPPSCTLIHGEQQHSEWVAEKAKEFCQKLETSQYDLVREEWFNQPYCVNHIADVLVEVRFMGKAPDKKECKRD